MEWIELVWAGFVATTTAAAFFWVARSFDWTQFSPTIHFGCLLVRDPRRPITETIGFLLLFLTGSTVAPVLLSALLAYWRGPTWAGGVIVGGLAGLATASALPLYGTISACVRSGTLRRPGPFGVEWGRATPAVVMIGHVIYGVVFAAIFSSF